MEGGFAANRIGGIMPTLRTGEDEMRTFVRRVCLLAGKPGLMALIIAAYPTVATAITALQAACAATGFDIVPEIQP